MDDWLPQPQPIEAALIPDSVAARIAGISRAHLHRLRVAGRWGPQGIRLGRKVLYRRDEVFAWIEASCPDDRTWAAMRASANRRLKTTTGNTRQLVAGGTLQFTRN